MPTTFKDFEHVFLEYYSLLNDANIVHNKLHKLKQHGAIQDYIMAFDNIIMLLAELPEADQVHTFVYDLKLHICKFIKA